MEVAPARPPPVAPTLVAGAAIQPEHTLPWWVRVPRRGWLGLVERMASPSCGRLAARVPALRLAAQRMCASAHRTDLDLCGGPFRVGPLSRGAIRAELFGGREHALALSWVRACVTPGTTVVDVCAGIGLVAIHMGEVAGPEGTVLAIEADPCDQELLAYNARHCRWRNIVPMLAAVGDRVGATDPRASAPRDGRDAGEAVGPEGRSRVPVRTTTLDEIADRRRIEVHFARIAARGAEIAILRGMRSTLSHPDFRGVVVRVSPPALRAAGEDPEDLLDRLRTADLLCANAPEADADPAAFLASIPDDEPRDLVYLRT